MGVLDDLALSGVDRVERSLGKKAALVALVPLLDTLPAGRGRGRAILRAFGYAAELGEEPQLEPLSARWTVEENGRAADCRRLVARLAASGHAAAAAMLAHAEVLRTRGQYDEAAARYAHARCLEATGKLADALAEHEHAARLANEQALLRQTARVREVRVLLALGRPDDAALRACRLLPLERGCPEDRLAVAVAALQSPGRYRRAAALDVLGLLAREGGDAGREALRWAALHAERAGHVLSSIEADRIEAALGGAAVDRVRALADVAAESPTALARAASVDPAAGAVLARAKAVAEGSAAGPRPDASGRALIGWLGLAAVSALRAHNRHEGRELLRELSEHMQGGARLEAPVWTAVLLALRDPRLCDVGRELAAIVLSKDGEPPPRGFASLAEALDAADATHLSTEAWRRAAARREPGAREKLAALLRHRGWQAAERGDRAAALTLLREARRLAGAERE